MTKLLLCAALIACAGNGYPAHLPSPQSVNRANILAERIAWIRDSIPVVRYAPPFVYGTWRLAIENCSGLTREGWPKFYVAPIAPLAIDSLGRQQVAFFAGDSDVIVVALGQEGDRSTITHELLHWLTEPLIPKAPKHEDEDAQHARTHPAEYFDVRCRALLTPSP